MFDYAIKRHLVRFNPAAAFAPRARRRSWPHEPSEDQAHLAVGPPRVHRPARAIGRRLAGHVVSEGDLGAQFLGRPTRGGDGQAGV